MNTQLQLLHVNESPAKDRSVHDKTEQYGHYHKIHNMKSDETWWRLTYQERQVGLASVRAIRAILNNDSPKESSSLRKAS